MKLSFSRRTTAKSPSSLLENDKPFMVLAIDFGTTYSSWACSMRHEYEENPTKIYVRQWIGGEHFSAKVPTTVLIKPDGKSLETFGYEAEDRYAELVEEGQHKHWYYFEKFKMKIFNNSVKKFKFPRAHKLVAFLELMCLNAMKHALDAEKGKPSLNDKVPELSCKTMIEDISGKPLPAMRVFSRAIQFMKDDFWSQFKSKIEGQMDDRDICWVLTVPAIWNESAKQFMRHAAAGIKNEHLRIALEPEAASLLCNYLPVKKFTINGSRSTLQTFQKGSKYMVLDAGGGTVDITVHELIGEGKLKELYKASGGTWGGTTVDEAFKQFIIQLVGYSVFQKFSREYTDDLLDMFRGFEVKKREIQPKKDSMITVRIPVSLMTLFQKEVGEALQEFISETTVFADKVKIVHGKLKVDITIFKDFFFKPVQNITSFVRTLLQEKQLKGVKSIIMVGGFSECLMLQESIRSNFPEISIIIPQDPGLVVLKGAVIYGHNQGAIVERVCRYTYGIGGSKPFIKGVHREELREETDVGPLCTYIFVKVVEASQSVKLNERLEKHQFNLNMENQDTYSFPIYVSHQASPMYVTDVGCQQVGCVSISGIDRSVPLTDRKVAVSIIFGGTEIEVEAREVHTGRKSTVILDFLQ